MKNQYAQALGRLKKGVKESPSEAKKISSAKNGKLGGRPKGSKTKIEIPKENQAEIPQNSVKFYDPDAD